MPTVTVFGSSRVYPGEAEYDEAYALGLAIAQQGWAVCTGGYDGTMAAVSKGVSDGGGHVTGITLQTFGERPGNQWLVKEVRTADLYRRLEELVAHGDAYIAIDGGVGTLLEVALIWNLAIVAKMRERPMVLVGHRWRAVLDALRVALITPESDFSFASYVPTVHDAVALLKRDFQARGL